MPVGLAVSAGVAAPPQALPVPPPAAAPVAPVEEPRPDPAPAVVEVAMSPPPEVFDAPPPPPPPPPAVLRAPPPAPGSSQSGGTWAVIIGIDDYPGTRSDLRSAVNDANDVDTALAGMGVPATNRLVMRNGQASADGIRSGVEWLVSRAGPDATAVFFYAGHVRKAGLTTEALVGADGRLIEDRELGERLSHLPARRAWIAMASCYGAGFTEVLAPGRVLTGAAGPDTLAYESSEYGRSFMVQYMVREAMIEKRAGATTVQAAFAYAIAELAREHPARQPVQIDMGLGPLDLRPLLAPEPAPSPPPTTPVTAPPTPPTTVCRQLLLFACR
ncbi:MAG: caspase family protein [Actinomycetota bacterium]